VLFTCLYAKDACLSTTLSKIVHVVEALLDVVDVYLKGIKFRRNLISRIL